MHRGIHRRTGLSNARHKGIAKAASPVPEREVSSHPSLHPAAAGSKMKKWKALHRKRTFLIYIAKYDYMREGINFGRAIEAGGVVLVAKKSRTRCSVRGSNG